MRKLPGTMQAMVLERQGTPLVRKTIPVPNCSPTQVLVKVLACGICRTDLHIIDGELASPKLPLILGHEIVGTLVEIGGGVTGLKKGDVVGIPWLGYTCGKCRYCLIGRENLCENAQFTGYTLDGGYAAYTVANARFCFLLPPGSTPETAPLLCAGLIGYRSYKLMGEGIEAIGIYGFGAAAHLITQLAVFQGKKVYAFTRNGDAASQQFARSLGAVWAGSSEEQPPQKLDGALIFAPAGNLIPKALKDIDKGGVVVCGGIHMSDIPSFPYSLLWGERSIRSVANLTRMDGVAFLRIAQQVPVKTQTRLYPLHQANTALDALRKGTIQGAAVLTMPQD